MSAETLTDRFARGSAPAESRSSAGRSGQPRAAAASVVERLGAALRVALRLGLGDGRLAEQVDRGRDAVASTARAASPSAACGLSPTMKRCAMCLTPAAAAAPSAVRPARVLPIRIATATGGGGSSTSPRKPVRWRARSSSERQAGTTSTKRNSAALSSASCDASSIALSSAAASGLRARRAARRPARRPTSNSSRSSVASSTGGTIRLAARATRDCRSWVYARRVREPGLLSVVAPMHDEEDTVDAFHERTVAALSGLDFELVLVDDGSRDATGERLRALAAADERVKVVTLSRNFGHQAALSAGLEHARGDVVVMLDADLQDPPELIPEMVDALARRRRRRLRRARARARARRASSCSTARWFYRLFARLARIELAHELGRLPADGPRAARRAARDARAQPLPARHDRLGRLHADGRAPTGARRARAARRSSRPRRMLRFAFDAITSFSHAPLQAATLLGFVFSFLAFLAIPLAVVARYADIYGRGVPTTIVIVLLLGGIQLITVGIIGEYVGRIYDEVKHRPLYVVRERVNVDAPGDRPSRARARRARGEDRRPRRRRVRPHRRAPARARRPRGRRLRALARARRPGGDARRRRRPPARALLPPPVHVRPRTSRSCTRELGMPDAIEWRALERRVLRARRAAPVRDAARPAALQPAVAARRACGWARRCSRCSASPATARRTSAITARDWIERAHGPRRVGRGLGAAAARQVRRARRRRSRWSGCGASCALRRSVRGEDAARSGSATRASPGSRCSTRSRGAVDGARRPRADRPRRRRGSRAPASGFGCTPAPPGSFRRGHDPRAFDAGGARDATTACSPTVPNDVFEELLDPALAGEVGEEYLGRTRSIEYFAALCLLLELDRRFSPYYWTNVADRALPFVGLIEHTNFVEPERYDGRRFLYVANYLAARPRAARARRRRAARALRARPARGQPGLLARLGAALAGCTPSRPRSRS